MTKELPDEQRCIWTRTTTGRRCRKPRTPGTTICATHGSKAPQVKAAAERRLATQAVQADAAAILANQGLTGVANPYEALSKLAAELLALKDAWAARVNALGDQIRFRSVQGTEQLRSEITAYERALVMAARVLETLAKLGLDERRVAVTEAMGEQVASVIQAVLDDLRLSERQQTEAPAVVNRHLLRLVTA